jgi:hypothetical protein
MLKLQVRQTLWIGMIFFWSDPRMEFLFSSALWGSPTFAERPTVVVERDHSEFGENDPLKTEKSQQNPRFWYEDARATVQTWGRDEGVEIKERSDRCSSIKTTARRK